MPRAYTRTKLVFDLNPRQYALEDVLADLRAAGLGRIAIRPFFVPQTGSLPACSCERRRGSSGVGPVARVALRFRFTYLIAASPR